MHGFRSSVTEFGQGASPVHVQLLLRHEDLPTMGYLDPDTLEIENLVKNL